MELNKMQKKTKYFALLGLFLLSNAFLVNNLLQNDDKQSQLTESITPRSQSDWLNITLPGGDIPDANISLIEDGETTAYSLTEIVYMSDYTNQTLPLVSKNDTENPNVEIIGFNPLCLMELEGWSDAESINIVAEDNYNKTFSVVDLLSRDNSYYKYSNNNATFIGFITNTNGIYSWLEDFDSGAGNFKVYGDDLAGNQKIHHVNRITLEEYWKVNVTIDGVFEGYFNSKNASSEVGNHTTYDWGYYDDLDNYGWPGDEGATVECSGYTVTSLIDTFLNNISQNYTVSLIAWDGYGDSKVFSKESIDNGFTGSMIGDPEEEMSNEGKQAMLIDTSDGQKMGYSRGPYQFIAPGLGKSSYIGGIVEIRITLIENIDVPSYNKGIPSYSLNIVLPISIMSIILLIKRKRN
jgi:hypothetical protein